MKKFAIPGVALILAMITACSINITIGSGGSKKTEGDKAKSKISSAKIESTSGNSTSPANPK